MNRNVWLGFLFLAALILLAFATLVVGELPFGRRYTLRVHFERVQGLRKGDDVRVEGLRMGRVEDLELHPDRGVVATLTLDRPLALYSDARIAVESSSVLGGSYVSILRGSREPRVRVDERTVLTGEARLGLEEIGSLVDENRENVRELIRNLREITQTIKEGPGTVHKLLATDELHRKAVGALESIEKAVDKLQERLGSEFIDAALDNVAQATANLRDATEALRKGEGPLGALLHDRAMTDRLQKTLEHVEKAGRNIEAITARIQSGEGPLGTLVHDKEMGERLKRTVENVEKSSESLRSITERLENGEGTVGKLLQDDELYEQAKQALRDVDRVLGRAARSVVEVAADSKFYNESHMQISRLGIRITPSEDKYFFVGAAFLSLDPEGDVVYKALLEEGDADTIIRPDVQAAYRIPWFLDRRLAVRGGLLEGKPGGGVEFTWDDWLLFRHPVEFVFEARDAYNDVDREDLDERIDGPVLRLFVKTPLWTRKESWVELLLSTVRLYGGVNRIGEDPEFLVGLGLEWPDEDLRTLVSLIGLAR